MPLVGARVHFGAAFGGGVSGFDGPFSKEDFDGENSFGMGINDFLPFREGNENSPRPLFVCGRWSSARMASRSA